MKQKATIQGFSHAIWTGVTTITLAKAMEKALEEDLTGLYHLVNNEKISKLELLRLFNQYMKDGKINITPSDQLIVDKSLINTRNDFSFIVPSYEEMIIEMKNWIGKHNELYPHYFE
jgi:dTDP-4-dehydrorhamnose reductase